MDSSSTGSVRQLISFATRRTAVSISLTGRICGWGSADYTAGFVQNGFGKQGDQRMWEKVTASDTIGNSNRLFLVKLALGIGWILGAAGGLAGEVAGEEPSARRERPNIVFIFSDDHAYQAISAYGSRVNQTPHLDRLAREGMRFDRCLVTNSICGPSRAVILTGKYSHLNGFRQNGDQFDGSQQTFPKLLQQVGYQTAVIGKWHLKSDPTGFDHWCVLPGQGAYYNPDFRTPSGNERVNGYCTDIVTDKALDWLKSGREQDRPFLLMLQHKAPHREWNPSPKYYDQFEGETVPEPETLFDDWSGRAEVLAENTMSIANHMRLGFDLKVFPQGEQESEQETQFFRRFTPAQKAAWQAAYAERNRWYWENRPEGREKTAWQYQRYIKDYLRCISSVDENVGRVLDYLDDSGLAENTVVIYSSDQGFYLGEHGWYDKRWIFEESLRTPLLVRWPGVTPAGSQSGKMVSNLDFAETFLELAGVEVPDDMQGRSLVPLLKGETPADWRDAFYYHYYELGTHNVAAHYGVVTDRYKLIHYYRKLASPTDREVVDIDQWDLMDRELDPLEMSSFIANPEYAPVREELQSRLEQLRTSLKVVD